MKRMGKCYKLNFISTELLLKTTNHIFKNVLFELEDLYHLSLLIQVWQLPPLASSLLLCLFPRGVHLSCREGMLEGNAAVSLASSKSQSRLYDNYKLTWLTKYKGD